MVYQFEAPFVVDGSKFRGAFGGGEATTYREGIRHTLARHRHKHVDIAGRTSPWWRDVLRYARASPKAYDTPIVGAEGKRTDGTR